MSWPTRRHFLLIAAGAACGGFGLAARSEGKSRISWQGVSLGARAQIILDHTDRDAAEAALAASRDELARLEGLFSLYREDSAIARLNRSGRLDAPAAEFLEILSTAASVHAASAGAFDPTVQPLWDEYARFYSAGAEDRGFGSRLEEALERTGFPRLSFDAGAIAFSRQGMALTLNGIAQGYITDRIADLLRRRGFENVLVDMGEIRAVGSQRSGQAWPVTIAGSNRVVSLRDRSLATSATLGTTFDSVGRVGHILDPRTGKAIGQPRQVTVSAPTAVLADALSTALCAAPGHAAGGLLAAFPDAKVISTLA
jgi:FAD:protein FMN transferase